MRYDEGGVWRGSRVQNNQERSTGCRQGSVSVKIPYRSRLGHHDNVIRIQLDQSHTWNRAAQWLMPQCIFGILSAEVCTFYTYAVMSIICIMLTYSVYSLTYILHNASVWWMSWMSVWVYVGPFLSLWNIKAGIHVMFITCKDNI